MHVWIYVEGESDSFALQALWADWRERLGNEGIGIRLISLGSKSKLLGRIGDRAAEKLVNNQEDLVIGLPDLYPNGDYEDTPFAHQNVQELAAVQGRRVLDALSETHNVRRRRARKLLQRFHPTALKHDLEMLLLAAKDQLRDYVRTSERLDSWRHPVEEQDQQHPPKGIVESIFRTKTKTRKEYRDTVHAPAVLGKVSDLRGLLYSDHNQLECPTFKAMLDWVGTKTGVRAY